MAEPANASIPSGTGMNAGAATMPKIFKYPSEEEYLVRRFGTALLTLWSTLPRDTQDEILAQAAIVWDRERDVPKLAQKLEGFVKRFPGRAA